MKIIFVGAFPSENISVWGGNITDCRLLMESSFARRLDAITIDSTQLSQPPPALILRAFRAFKRLVEFHRALSQGEVDAVLIFSSGGLSFFEKGLMTAWASKKGFPVLLAIRSGHFMQQCECSSLFRLLAKKCIKYSTLLICQGREWQRFYRKNFGYDANRCPVVNSWAVTDDLLQIKMAQPEGRCVGQTLTVLYLGWIERFKGIFELLEAAHRLQTDPFTPQFRLILAGGGKSLEDAKSWVYSKGMDDCVSFLGWVAPERCLNLFEEADIFVLPSHTEGFPNAMIEAMGAGKPVIVTPVGSIPDVIEDGKNGLIISVGDIEGLSKSLTRLLREPRLRYRIGVQARKTASERFQVETAASRLIYLIERVTRQD